MQQPHTTVDLYELFVNTCVHKSTLDRICTSATVSVIQLFVRTTHVRSAGTHLVYLLTEVVQGLLEREGQAITACS